MPLSLMPPELAGLKDQLAQLSQPDPDGVYREGPARRAARSQAVRQALLALWEQAVGAVAGSAATEPSAESFAAGSQPASPQSAVPFVIAGQPVAGQSAAEPSSTNRRPADRPLPGVGLAAVGSLARGQFAPHSDLDLVLIYDERQHSAAAVKALADRLWYPLWDCGLSLDHSVRTVHQCEEVTDSDLPAVSGWLAVSPLAGDAELIGQVSARILSRWRKLARKRLGELAQSAQARAEESGALPYLGQPNLKEARGGLRDSSLVTALAASWLADRPHGLYDGAVDRLLDVRDCLQLVAGKETNILTSQYQPQVAALLGLADPTLPSPEREQEASVDLQALLARLGRRIAYSLDSTLSHARRSLTHDKPRLAFLPASFGDRLSARRPAPRFETVAPGVCLHEGEIVLDATADVLGDRALPLRVALAAAERELPIAPVTVNSLERCPVEDSAWSEETRQSFVRLLMSGPALIPVWEELDMAQVPGRLVPEWEAVRNRPAASAVHRFTVDRHMVETVSRLGATAPTGQPYSAEQAQQLFLAAIFHDIGKRRGVADHSVEGARQAQAILSRMGFAPATVERSCLLIREHLSLSAFATGRDPEDQAAWQELAARLDGDPLLLDMLFDLTRADSSSLGATPGELLSKRLGWSSWRERLVTGMYRAVRSWMVAG